MRSPQAGGRCCVEAIVGDVRLAAGKPLGKRLVPNERLLERLEPMQFFAGQVGPELRRIGGGLVPKLLIFVQRFDAGSRRELLRRRKQPLLFHHGIDLIALRRRFRHVSILSSCDNWIAKGCRRLILLERPKAFQVFLFACIRLG